MVTIKGRKGGSSKPRTPVEQRDNLQSVAKAKILLALGEGEFAGEVNARNIYFDGTPLENEDGTQNFEGAKFEFRSGTQSQEYIQGMPSSENEITVGNEIKSGSPWTRTFANSQLSAVRVRLKWPSLFKQEDNGDLNGNVVKYKIEVQTDGGQWIAEVESQVDGKTTQGYERSHRVNLPQDGKAWAIRVIKLTKDANSAKIGDVMTIQSFTEVIDAKLRYPNTALLYVEFDSSQFGGSIPQISCEPKGRVIRLPSNYNPETRVYSGVWDGVFKWAWTDNPAWIYYDIVINDRFGLGDRLTTANIDKWTLYEVSQYCDQLVPNGKGGNELEPRYTCNVYVQDRNDAYTVLRDFAAIFRGMTYWGGDQLVAMADMPRDVDYSYTRANVIDGKFNYSSSSTKSRYTTALVSWSDPDNAYSDAMEPVFENNLVNRYGFNQLEITAIGCTRQSEANRKGRWGILTNNKDRVVSFGVGLDGNIPQPGYIISIADELLSGRVMGGRISAVNGRSITLDRKPHAKEGDRLIINLPSGKSQSRTIQAVNDNKITVTTEYKEVPQAESVWVIESDELYVQQYRVISVTDNDEASFTIVGAYHDPSKYEQIDTGAAIEQRPISVIPPDRQLAPSDVVISSYSSVNQGISIETLRCQWSATENSIAYEAQWRRNEGNWVNVPRSSVTSFEITGVYAGRYVARVRAINAAEISSGWSYSDETILNGKQGNPPKPLNLRASAAVWGIDLDWNFDADTSDTLKTELQYSSENTPDSMQLLADVPYPLKSYRMSGLKAGIRFYFRARLVDKTGNQSEWTSIVFGESSSDAKGILEAVGDKFLSTEAGQHFQDQIDFNQNNVTLQLEQAAEATLNNTIMLNQVSFRLFEEEGSRKAEIFRLEQVRISDNEALARWQQQVSTDYEQTSSAVLKVQESISTLEESTAKDISQVKAEIKQVDDKLGNIDARITDQSEAIATIDETQTKHIETAESRFGDNEALINQLARSLANAESSLAEMGMQLSAEFGNQAIGQLQIKSSVTRLDKVVADNEHTFAQSIERLNSQYGETQAAIEKMAKTEVDHMGNASSIISYKAAVLFNGQYYDAKMMIGAEVKNGKVVTQIGFSADTFGIFNPASGKLEPVFFVENGQVFINEAFINQATIEKLLIGSTIKSKNWDPAAKKGLMLDFEKGKLIANDAEITGTIYANDGEFKGTVYVNKLIGDNATATVYKQVTKSETHGDTYDQIIETSVIYVGGMPYDVDLLMPTMQFESTGSYTDAIANAYVSVIIDGVTYTPQTTRVKGGKDWSLICSLYVTIPASKKDVKITIKYITYHRGGCSTKIHPAMIIACKHNSSSFK